MSFIKSIKSKIRSWNLKRRGLIDDDYADRSMGGQTIWNSIKNIISLPIRLLLYPLRLINLIQTQDAATEENSKKRGFYSPVILTAKWVLSFPFLLLREPSRIFQSLRRVKPRDLVFALPAISIIGLFGFVFIQIFVYANAIDNRYARGAQLATERKDFDLAKTYYQRILADNNISPQQQFDWAMILAKTGETEKALGLIQKIAPDNSLGFAPGHRLIALSMATQVGSTDSRQDPTFLKKLNHHLIASRSFSPEIFQAWAAFYVATEQKDKAISSLDRAAEKNPSLYISISELYKQSGQNAESRNTLEKAELAFRELLEKDKLDDKNRIAFAKILALVENYQEAEEVLQQGQRIKPDPLIKRALSDFYAMRYDIARSEAAPAQDQMNFLMQAIETDPDHIAVYSRMIQLFSEAGESPEQAKKIRAIFEEIVTGGNPTALAHFALSNILWIVGERDRAEFHLEQAYLLNNNFVVIINNLAWILAHNEDPDLERALNLAKTAVERAPQNPRYRDTLGTVLLKLQLHQEAISELQLALKGTPDTNLVHKKLAICYKSLGMEDLALMHLRKTNPKK
jgi:tetratricopeptide (TPR) repeat protein